MPLCAVRPNWYSSFIPIDDRSDGDAVDDCTNWHNPELSEMNIRSDTCFPIACQAIACPLGQTGKDTDGDGCADTCFPVVCQAIACPLGQTGKDTDGDGCPDTCFPLSCKAIA